MQACMLRAALVFGAAPSHHEAGFVPVGLLVLQAGSM
jgi:hypothetical protein